MSAATNNVDPEVAVRLYLVYLEDPAQLRDVAEVQTKTQAVLDAADPIDKLKAIAARQRVASIDEKPLREGFVEHAKTWAAEQHVPVSAFRELRASDDVLRDAGFDVPTGRRGRGVLEGRQRAKAVPVEEIKAYVLAQKGTFILTDIIGGIGGSQATVRKAVDELLEAGQIEKLGPVPGYQGRGRAPIQYNKS